MNLRSPEEERSRPVPVLALTKQERKNEIDILHSERFQDKAPRQIYATLLDEGQYHCSVRTMYRILTDGHGNVKELRRYVKHLNYE